MRFIGCPRASKRTAKIRKAAPLQRLVLRSVDQDLFDQVQGHMRDPEFGKRWSERMWKIEGLCAEAKQNHGLSRARYRGRSKVQIRAYLSATAQNLKSPGVPILLLACRLVAPSVKHSLLNP